MTPYSEADFVARKNISGNGSTFKLRPPEEAVKLLRRKDQRIQDKGSILSVLLRGAAINPANVGFVRTQIKRDRLKKVPEGVKVQYPRDRSPHQRK